MSTSGPWLRCCLALLAGTLLAGCAWLRGAQPGVDVAHPNGDALILRVYGSGGFVPADYQLTSLPTFTLLGDGRVIVAGATDLVYPGPILPSLQVRRLTERGIQAVLATVEGSRQLQADHAWTGASSHVADAGDTVFVLHAGDRDVTVRVYALGILDGGMAGISDEERKAHLALGQLLGDLTDLDSWVGAAGWADPAWSAYQADALRLVVRQADDETPAPDELPFNELPWPSGSIDPATFGTPVVGEWGRCGLVIGSQAVAWYGTLRVANQLTRWVAGSHRYVVSVRPLMPDEPADCAPAT